MILVTHGIIGGAVVALLPTHPVIGVTLAFASHFAFDAIPHWDYKIYSQSIHPDFRENFDLIKISFWTFFALEAMDWRVSC
jgi:hypothetical protein